MKVLRKTKIICTIGPATSSEDKIRELIDAGMNCARINCSHGSCSDRMPVVSILRKVRKELNYPLALLLDTKGPEFRIKTFENESIELADGDDFIFTTEDVEGNQERVSVTYKNLCEEINPGDIILVNDGLVKFEVVSVDSPNVKCKTIIGGTLSNNKSMNFPGKDLKLDFLSETDKRDLLFAIENKFNYIACSFVSNADDIRSAREFLDNNGGRDIYLIAKIENQSGVDNLEEICKYCNGIMVARGDLGVEVDYDKLPSIQKSIIRKCQKLGKLAVTSTEMLESMVHNPRPTRAEISDVANAVYDGTSAIMLSGETAAGKYPIESCKTMAKIAFTTEKNINYKNLLSRRKPVKKERTVDAIALATCSIAVDVDAKAIINLTASGFTSEMISNYRPHVDVLTITTDKEESFKLALYFAVNPLYFPKNEDMAYLDVLNLIKSNVAEHLDAKEGEKFVVNDGYSHEDIGYTNTILVEAI